MKRLFFTSVVTLSVVFGVLSCGENPVAEQIENKGTAEKPKADNNKPKGTPAFKDTVWDFNRVEEGEEVKHSYIFTNTGKGDLQIRSAQASCGCTSPNWSKDPIPPGGTGFVDAKFNSTDRGGPDGIANEKKITVTFENSTQETIELKFKATVFSKKGKESDSDHNNH
jgi:hypothetical protein